jgi:hypothetical protein
VLSLSNVALPRLHTSKQEIAAPQDQWSNIPPVIKLLPVGAAPAPSRPGPNKERPPMLFNALLLVDLERIRWPRDRSDRVLCSPPFSSLVEKNEYLLNLVP